MSIFYKSCVGCKQSKKYDDFTKNKTKKDGLNNYCKLCQKNYREKNKEQIREQQKEYRQTNKEKLFAQQTNYRKNNKHKIRERDRNYRLDNKEKIKLKHQQWSNKNKEYIRAYKNQQYHNKHKHSIQNRLRSSLRSRIRLAINKGKKCAKTMELIGCSLDHFRQHIEKQFVDGMNWNNYGLYGWHIDHILPCSNFDLTDPLQQKLCFNYANLQPLWAKDNLKKSNKL